MKPIKPGAIAVLCVRALSAAIIIGFALGYPIRMQTLQAAELVTVCINTVLLVLTIGLLAILAGHALLSTGLPKAPTKRTPTWTVIFGFVLALELSAFALIGWWFTLAVRVTYFVIVKTTTYEKAEA